MPTKIIILAAGQGTRMRSDKPKVLATIAGKPLLHHILGTCLRLGVKDQIVIGGYQFEKLKEEIDPFFKVTWLYQEQQLGTAHAVGLALKYIEPDDVAIILAGDVPLISEHTLERLVALSSANQMGTQMAPQMGIVTQHLNDPSGYGRIKRDQHGELVGIVEHKDASADELKIKEINTGIMAIPGAFLKNALPKIGNNNAQKEYYLTDIIELAKKQGLTIQAIQPEHDFEVKGVNSKQQLANLEREYQLFLANELMAKQGVSFIDPSRVEFRGRCHFEKDVEVDINVIFEGEDRIGKGCKIGANTILKNVTLGDNVIIEPMSILDNALVKNNAVIGPFARLRPGTEIGEGGKIGNFVEVKKSIFGKGSKANHLSYIGDADVGEGVNIGAGTITCNYDGVNKHKTEIEDGAFIGSNTSLVAPVKIGKNSNIGAGSTITKNTPANKLTLARAKQLVIESWTRPEKKPK
jgi:bifunctional UDP-N-acetylglucosamine pyrophosphorylase / glucosamine-1-phosphate N-acetyltransferase